MVSYVALIRGINVGGNNIIKMADLKACFEKAGFTRVTTLIQSGNVVFESSIADEEKLESKVEQIIEKTFSCSPKVMVRSYNDIKNVLAQIPNEWKKRSDIRKYIAFIKEPMTSKEAAAQVDAKEGVDMISTGDGVVFMTTILKSLTKSGLSKLSAKKVYQHMTIRNLNTTQKILVLMEGKP